MLTVLISNYSLVFNCKNGISGGVDVTYYFNLDIYLEDDKSCN